MAVEAMLEWPSEDLHNANIDAVLDQHWSRMQVTQGVRNHPARDPRGLGGGGEGCPGQHPLVDRCVAASIGEQPAAVAMGAPQAFQFVEDRLWQRHQPLPCCPCRRCAAT